MRAYLRVYSTRDKRGVVLLRVKSKRGEEEVVPGSCWDVVPGRHRERGLPHLIFSDGSRQEPLPQKAAPFRPSAQPEVSGSQLEIGF